jgi:cytochrome c oxidase assembly protein subunit 11
MNTNALRSTQMLSRSVKCRPCRGHPINHTKTPPTNHPSRRFSDVKSGDKITLTESQAAALAQRRAYEYYRKKAGISNNHHKQQSASLRDRNIQIASYAAAAVIGALGATYAAVPLYKVFCQTTGFGGTTQRVQLTDWASSQTERESSGRSKVSQALWEKLLQMSNVPREMLPNAPGTSSHGRGAKTWTDEEAAAKLASLRPRKDGKLITVRFDSTVGDVLPWSFVPTQLDVKVVPGETALSFFTATNHSDRAITGVATYNVHPPKVGLYFNKIQCFCFEEQRLLPGETVDMPVFFFIDPEIMEDPQLRNVRSVTLSYTFFQTDIDDDEEDDEEDEAA